MEDVHQSPDNFQKLTRSKLIPLLLVCILVLLFYPSVSLLYTRWVQWDEGLSHGLMIIGLFLFFLFKDAPWVATSQPRWMTALLLAGLALVSIFWFLAHVSNIFILEQLALIPALMLLVAAGFGWRTAYEQKMLLAMPIFAIPIWDVLNSPLVNLSSLVVGKLVQLLGITAVIDGNSIFIPFGHILIADGCSGIRYFVIALALAYIISYLNHYRFHKLLITLMVAATLGLVANWVRIFLLVVIGYETEMKSSLMNDHEYFGWFIFAIIGFPAIYFAPVVKTIVQPRAHHGQHQPGVWLMAVFLLALGPLLNLIFNPAPQTNALIDYLDKNLTPIADTGMPLQITSPLPARRDNAFDGQVYYQIDQYQRLQTRDKLVPYIKRLYNHEQWSVINQQFVELPGISAQLAQFRHKNKGKTVIQLQWLSLAGTTTHSLALAKLLQIPAQLRGQNHFMIISLQANCIDDNCAQSQEHLFAVANTMATNPLLSQGD